MRAIDNGSSNDGPNPDRDRRDSGHGRNSDNVRRKRRRDDRAL